MKQFILAVITLLIAAAAQSSPADKILTQEEQERIVANYLYVMGELDDRSPLASAVTVEQTEIPLKCATSAVLEFQVHRRQIDPGILGSMATPRPVNEYAYDSPGGHFKIHYSTTGLDAVYQSGVDNNHNGIPDFVDGVAQAADSVYQIQVNVMGFTAPPADSFYSEGGDARYDIYLRAVSASFYGLAYPDVIVGDSFTSIIATSFIILDNDYQGIDQYRSRPLDAARVTLAHEFFHAVQFGIDFTEFDDGPAGTPDHPWWMEMSATWMEEHIYDDINDYYAYLPFFYAVPLASIQQFKSGSDAHAYGAVVWPIYLSEKFGPGMIKAVWDKCGQLGIGSHALMAFDLEIDSISGSAMNFSTAFNEFAVWNFFTGQYASTAPGDLGFEEKEEYPVLPLDSMARHNSYPLIVTDAQNSYRPQHNGTTYIRFEDVNTILSEYWHCADSSNPGFCDSVVVNGNDTVSCCYFDTSLTLFLFGRNMNLPWTVSLVYQLESNPDSFFVEQYPVENTGATFWVWGNTDVYPPIISHDPSDYRSVTVIASTNTTNFRLYAVNKVVEFAYGVIDTSGYRMDIAGTPPSVLTPYPNPAVVAEMGDQQLTFRFQVAIDSLGIPDASAVDMRIDLFSVAGERVRTINGVFAGEDRIGVHRTGVYTAEWNMANDHGTPVSSGAYLAFARLFVNNGQTAVAEKKVKVAVIR